MSKTIYAIFENGVFRPTDLVDLPERSLVEFEPRPSTPPGPPDPETSDPLDGVYAALGVRFASGHPDTAARHDEH